MADKDDPYVVLDKARKAWDNDPAFRAAWNIYGPVTKGDEGEYDMADERGWEQLLLDVVKAVKDSILNYTQRTYTLQLCILAKMHALRQEEYCEIWVPGKTIGILDHALTFGEIPTGAGDEKDYGTLIVQLWPHTRDYSAIPLEMRWTPEQGWAEQVDDEYINFGDIADFLIGCVKM